MSNDQTIRGFYPGHHSRRIAKTILVSSLIFLTIVGSIGAWLPGLVSTVAGVFSSSPEQTHPSCLPVLSSDSTSPQTNTSGSSCPPLGGLWSNDARVAGAGPLPNLSLPKTVLSSVDGLIGAGGVINTSRDNLTLYNSVMAMRLLGGSNPMDELLGPGPEVLSTNMFWRVEVNMSRIWVPLVPVSSSFTLLGTNATGTYVVRLMQVSGGLYSGVLKIVYSASPAGPLKWDLEFTATTAGNYGLAFSWSNITSLNDLSSADKRIQVNYPRANYTFSWGDVPSSFNATTQILPGQFLLSIDLGALSSGSSTYMDHSLVSTTQYGRATAYTFQRKVFYEPKGGYYFAFYGASAFSNITYRFSHNGTSWSSPQFTPLLPERS